MQLANYESASTIDFCDAETERQYFFNFTLFQCSLQNTVDGGSFPLTLSITTG